MENHYFVAVLLYIVCLLKLTNCDKCMPKYLAKWREVRYFVDKR